MRKRQVVLLGHVYAVGWMVDLIAVQDGSIFGGVHVTLRCWTPRPRWLCMVFSVSSCLDEDTCVVLIAYSEPRE